MNDTQGAFSIVKMLERASGNNNMSNLSMSLANIDNEAGGGSAAAADLMANIDDQN